MTFRYKPEDFIEITRSVELWAMPNKIADHANALLEKHVAGLHKVTGLVYIDPKRFILDTTPNECDTHTAIIWSIEPIKRECEKPLEEIKIDGLTIDEVRSAIMSAKLHGWTP